MAKKADVFSALTKLISAKTLRDKKRFTPSALSNALGLKRSVIQRLVHPDPEKRVTNPRVDTLMKIVNFFREDGFNISLDHFTSGSLEQDTQNGEHVLKLQKTIELYPSAVSLSQGYEAVELKLLSDIKRPLAYMPAEGSVPFFQDGMVYVMETDENPDPNANQTIIVKTGRDSVVIGKYSQENNQSVVTPLIHEQAPVQLSSGNDHTILGVVKQIVKSAVPR